MQTVKRMQAGGGAIGRVIGIVGRAFSGKDTVAAYLLEQLKRMEPAAEEWQTVSFAAPMKRSIEAMLSLPPGSTDDRERRKEVVPAAGCTLARLMQLYAHAMRESVSRDLWVQLLFARYKPSSRWIITDVRYPNEAAAIRDRGGILVRIYRTSPPAQSADVDDGRDRLHPSEALSDTIHCDYTIENDHSLAELRDSVSGLCTALLADTSRH